MWKNREPITFYLMMICYNPYIGGQATERMHRANLTGAKYPVTSLTVLPENFWRRYLLPHSLYKALGNDAKARQTMIGN